MMGLHLLSGIRCALFVCFVSVRKAGPSQNLGSVSGSVTIFSGSNTNRIWLSDMGIVCVDVADRCVASLLSVTIGLCVCVCSLDYSSLCT